MRGVRELPEDIAEWNTRAGDKERVALHRFRPIGADYWSDWRMGAKHLTPGSGMESENAWFVRTGVTGTNE